LPQQLLVSNFDGGTGPRESRTLHLMIRVLDALCAIVPRLRSFMDFFSAFQ